MKGRVLIIFSLLLLTVSCKKESPGVYDNFLGTWYLSAAYKDGESVNWLRTIILFDSCVKNSNITFTNNATFSTQSSCEGGSTYGFYEVSGDSLFATDSTKTEVFLFLNGSLLKNVEFHDVPFLGNFTCNLEFKKTEELTE
ncbi:MAG: hypothetical protein EOM76_09400 [Sphingobacteriia bacterium]|nr:lipocalin family protein [Paludibacteraceae bacterium]NCA80379.1 hypothetical protein [Sphingobacteriia bacterium]